MIRYSYLWLSEHRKGREEGSKDRPCSIVLSRQNVGGDVVVTVLPIAHTPPTERGHAIEIPSATKQRLGLDEAQSWIVLSEANQFVWPGPDPRPVTGKGASDIAYGLLPASFFETIRRRLVELLKNEKFASVPRTE